MATLPLSAQLVLVTLATACVVGIQSPKLAKADRAEPKAMRCAFETTDAWLGKQLADLHRERGALRRLSRRARRRAYVPTLRLGGRIGQGLDWNQRASGIVWGDARTWRGDNNWSLTASLRFNLSRATFAREELAIARLAARSGDGRRKARQRLTKHYIRWRRACCQWQRERPAPSLREAVDEAKLALAALLRPRTVLPVCGPAAASDGAARKSTRKPP